MADDDDRIASTPLEQHPQHIGYACEQVLEGVAVREPHQLRRHGPTLEQIRPPSAHVVARQPLPIAVIQIDEIREYLYVNSRGGRDRRCRFGTAPQGTCIHHHWSLPPGDVLRHIVRLLGSLRRERYIPATAEALRADAVNVARAP